MKKNIFIIFAAIFTLLSCSNSLQPPALIKTDKAYVSFALNETAERTILPTTLDKKDLSYELAYQKKNTEVLSLRKWNSYQDMEKTFADKIELECGNWVFILTAKKNSKAVYISSVEKEVKPGENSILFSFEEVEDGNGSFSVTANLSVGKSEKVTAALFDIENKPVEGFEEEVLELKKLENKVTTVYEKEDVPCGYYIVKFFVYRYADDSEYEVVKSELVRVASGNISVGEVFIDNNWNKTINLFTGTENDLGHIEEQLGAGFVSIPLKVIIDNPDAYILLEHDTSNGESDYLILIKNEMDYKLVWGEGYVKNENNLIQTDAIKCSEILSLLSEEDMLLEELIFADEVSVKINCIKLTYETVTVSYDGEGVDLGKSREKLPVGMTLKAPEKHKENFVFDYWKNAAGERVDTVPECNITLYPVWKKTVVLFPGINNVVDGVPSCYLLLDDLRMYPDAYLIIEDDVSNGNRNVRIVTGSGRYIYNGEYQSGLPSETIKVAFRCSDILDLLTDDEKDEECIRISDWGSKKIKSIYLTYDFTNITYMKDGGEIEKLSEALPAGVTIKNDGVKDGMFFCGWMTEASDKVTVVPEEDVTLYPIWLERLDIVPSGTLITRKELEKYPDATLVLRFSCDGSGGPGTLIADRSGTPLESWPGDYVYDFTRKYKVSYLIEYLKNENKDTLNTNMGTALKNFEIKALYFTYSEKPDVQINIADRHFFYPKNTKIWLKETGYGGIEIHVNCDGGLNHYRNNECKIAGGKWSSPNKEPNEERVVTGFYLDENYKEKIPQSIFLTGDITIFPKYEKIYSFTFHVGDEFYNYSYFGVEQFKFMLPEDESLDIGFYVEESGSEPKWEWVDTEDRKVYLDPDYSEEVEFGKYYFTDHSNLSQHFYLKPLSYKVVFDPASLSIPDYYGDGKIVEINGKKYIKVKVDGYRTILHINEIDLSKYTTFKAEMFGAESDSTLKYVIKLMENSVDLSDYIIMNPISDVPQYCSAGIAKAETTWDGNVSENMICNQIQFIVQEIESNEALSDIEVYLGKILVEIE